MRSSNGVVMLDVKEAAALAGRTPETVRRWIWSGRLVAQRQGRRLMVDRDDVLRVAGAPQSGGRLTLREWAVDVRGHDGQRRTETTAADLVAEDRAVRSGQILDVRR